jgi:glycosyltransferase involved in cell wall biosynthesis
MGIRRSVEGELSVAVDLLATEPVVGGGGRAIFVLGRATAAGGDVSDLGLALGSHPARPIVSGVPIDGPVALGEDPASRTGFWAILEAPAGSDGELPLTATAGVDGRRVRAELGTIAVRVSDQPAARFPDGGPLEGATVAIAIATYEPPADLLRNQLESIRAQTREDWICVISDDASSPERFADLRAAVGDDPRFLVSRAERRGGFYRNFERALRMVPPGVEYVALADQDDRWRPDKLARLVAAIGDTNLVYSDARIVDQNGAVISPTYWVGRRNNHTNLASLVIANTVTGAASLFRRELLDDALPFPSGPGAMYHDHWIALVALTLGDLRYLPEPLYDYVQHGGAFLGHAAANALGVERDSIVRRVISAPAIYQRSLRAWRRYYFEEQCRTQLLARVLRMRCGQRTSRRKLRTLGLFADGERSALAHLWLGLRSLRTLIGRNETLGVERGILRGIAWRRLLELAGTRPRFPRPTLAAESHADPLATSSPARESTGREAGSVTQP